MSDPRAICPSRKRHTKAPDGYLQWHEWAERKGKTHKQIKCEGCERYSIWVLIDPPGDTE